MTARYEVSLGPKGGLLLHIPEPEGYPDGHLYSVELPFTQQGMLFIRRTLKAHEENPGGKIVAAKRSPTQIQVEEWLKTDRLAQQREVAAAQEEKTVKVREADAKAIAGIDLDSLDLSL
jgi:hypothetical protein